MKENKNIVPERFNVATVVQLNPAIAHFKGLVKNILYTGVFIIANI